eukprot:8946647-Pyramimonas_sp.AAC.1
MPCLPRSLAPPQGPRGGLRRRGRLLAVQCTWDTLYHRLWDCPAVAEARAAIVPQPFLDSIRDN